MKVPSTLISLGQSLLPTLLDDAVDELIKAKVEQWPMLEVAGKQYLPKPVSSKLNIAVVILRRLYHAVLVLTGKARAVQFAEEYGPLKQAARRAGAAVTK